MTKLPEKLSDCLELALHDLELCEKDKRYIIDMKTWHGSYDHSSSRICKVCLGGAVIAKTLHISSLNNCMPEYFDMWTHERLNALDYLRKGQILSALSYLGICCPFGIPDYVCVTPYHKDPTTFKAEMQKIVKLLRRCDL